MKDNTNFSRFWKQWRINPSLPAHLPRLMLAERYQPRYVRRCAITREICDKLKWLEWDSIPLSLSLNWQGERCIPLAAYIGSYLIKLDQQLPTFGKLRQFLRAHPALLWALGFPLSNLRTFPSDLEIEMCLPSQQHFSRKLSRLPNEILQSLLDGQVLQLQELFGEPFGEVVSLDTKHVIAWVKENNPKAFIKKGRFDKTQQPAGDSDCKLGCKRKRNQKTPTKEGQPANEKASIGEYYWGYASGVVVTKIKDVGEFVLAETTQTFDFGDLTYFFPLMTQVEARLGHRPRYFTADAAFDAFYVHDYFHSNEQDGFAAVPLRRMNDKRSFDENGLPLCEADLPFHVKGTFVNKTSLVQHRKGRYLCPLLHPEPNGQICPINHPKWDKGGCKLVMPTAIGARLRYQLDRQSSLYKEIYNQRTAVERIFSQAKALGIERPKLRNQVAIANMNTLTYVLINLRAIYRLLGSGQ